MRRSERGARAGERLSGAIRLSGSPFLHGAGLYGALLLAQYYAVLFRSAFIERANSAKAYDVGLSVKGTVATARGGTVERVRVVWSCSHLISECQV